MNNFSVFIEALSRAIIVAKESGENEVKPEHIHRILPQLLLDF